MGYYKLVKIDLDRNLIYIEDIPINIIKMYLGGKGINIYYLLKNINEKMKPLLPKVPLIFSNGLLTGGPALSSSRIHISSISPLTGLIGSSNAGGFFGAELRACGFLSLFITGKSKKPVYIYINDNNIEIRDAEKLWGLETDLAYKKLKDEFKDENLRIALIGPAGENLVSFASIIFPPHDAGGRTGLGAVMGSKNLKAVVIKANNRKKYKNTPEIREIIHKHLERMKNEKWFKEYSIYGDSRSVKWINELGAGTVRNFNDVIFEKVDSVDGIKLTDYKIKRKSCFNCPLHCRAEVEITDLHGGFIGHRPDYESMEALGPRIGNDDIREIVYLNTMCNKYGMDTIEVGSIIAFAIDLYKKGIITDENTNNLNLNWGDSKIVEILLNQIAFKTTWLGKILSQGIKKASEIINNGAEKYAYHVKGLSITGMDPRGFKASSLGFAIGSRGADFTNVYSRFEYSATPEEAEKRFGTKKAADRISEEGKAAVVRYSIIGSTVMDALGLCKIPYLTLLNDFDFSITIELISNLLDWDFKPDDLAKCGERIVNAERVFNLKRGMKASDDKLPEKFIKEPIENGICKGSKVNLMLMLEEYYRIMGWKKNGEPSKEKIKELGLEEIAYL